MLNAVILAAEAAEAVTAESEWGVRGVLAMTVAALIFVFTRVIPQMQRTFVKALGDVLEHCQEEARADREMRHETANKHHASQLRSAVAMETNNAELRRLGDILKLKEAGGGAGT